MHDDDDAMADEIDAFMAPRAPALTSPNVGLLFRDSMDTAKDYYKRTGIFPIMHLIGVRKTLAEKHPWLPAAVLKAFEQSKAAALAQLIDVSATKVTLPFVEEQVAAAQALMGEDFWPYGLEKNRTTIEAFLKFGFEQGVCHKKLSAEELFAKQVLTSYKV